MQRRYLSRFILSHKPGQHSGLGLDKYVTATSPIRKYFDLIIANDIEALPLGSRLSRNWGSKLFLDAHEYKPREYDDRFLFRFFLQGYWDYICRAYLPHVDAMTTVCDGIANEYRKVYGVECKVVTNAPFFVDLEPSKTQEDLIQIIHHGSTNASRRLENMIYLMDEINERFRLDFMLVNNNPVVNT